MEQKSGMGRSRTLLLIPSLLTQLIPSPLTHQLLAQLFLPSLLPHQLLAQLLLYNKNNKNNKNHHLDHLNQLCWVSTLSHQLSQQQPDDQSELYKLKPRL
jgi:hypothetical protein